MAVVRCPRGHFYDDEKFSRCPHCGVLAGQAEDGGGAAGHGGAGSGAGGDGRDNGASGGRRKGLFRWLDREQTVAYPSQRQSGASNGGQAGSLNGGMASSSSGGIAGASVSGGQRASLDDVRTAAFGAGRQKQAGILEDERTAAFGSGESTAAFPSAGSLSGFSGDGAHTIALERAGDDEDAKTIGIYSGARGNDYVTGWLVCLKGPEKGRDYRLHHGFNRVGRGLGMDVAIMDEPAVSRDCHCSVVYDGVGNHFSLVPGNGTLTYLRGDLVSEPRQLSEGDEITIGGTCLVLVPFCREGRVWDEDEKIES